MLSYKQILKFSVFFLLLNLYFTGFSQTYDLEISKQINYTLPGLNGNDIPFEITIYNHGDDVMNIEVTDSIPVGYTFNSLLNPSWTDTYPNVVYNSPDTLFSGDSIKITIELTLDSIAQPSNMLNKAIISSFADTNNIIVTDSNPLDNEDTAMAPIFDLALRNKLIIAPYSYTSAHLFRLTVFNQGSMVAKDIEIKDFIPQGYYYLQAANAGWSVGPNPNYIIAGPLNPGDSAYVDILLYLISGDGGIDFWSNRATIWNANDDQDINRNVWDFDSEFGTNETHETAVLGGTIFDDEIYGRALLNDPLTGNKILNLNEDEDDFDVACPEIYDMAIQVNQSSTLPSFSYGSFVEFDIKVINQGNLTASQISLIDTIPCGLIFEQAENPTWTFNATTRKATTSFAGPILPNSDTLIKIKLRVDTCFENQLQAWLNYKEISAAKDIDGNDIIDIDSTPDEILFNDNIGNQNEIKEDGKNGGDEDDHDFHMIEIVDLALKKTVPNGVFVVGDTVPFTINLYNQGNVVLEDIHILEHGASDYIFRSNLNPGWVTSGLDYSFTTTGQLHPEDSLEITFNLILDGYINVENYAEVESVRDSNFVGRNDDADSQVNSNTPQEQSVHQGDPDDNNLNSLGEFYYLGAQDQDDHDPAKPIVSDLFDLALIKTHRILPPDLSYGDEIIFDITIINQGDIKAQNVEISDIIPCGFMFDSILNPTWSFDSLTSIASKITTGLILPNNSIKEALHLIIQKCDSDLATAWLNTAEVTSATDAYGNTVPDVDSTPNNNDPLEDDQDEDMIDVFDLAVIKSHDNTNEPFTGGDLVTFNFNIFNQGNVDALNIELTDFIPCGLFFDSNLNPNWNYNIVTSEATLLIMNPLASSDSVEVSIILTVQGCTGSPLGAWTNIVEITGATNLNGNPSDDLDSTPANNELSEDDQDDDEIIVELLFDLSLTKTHQVLPTDLSYGDVIIFDITVLNEGDITAANIEITDYIPCGFVFDSNLNPNWTYDAMSSTASKIIPGSIVQDSSVIEELHLIVQSCESNTASAWINIAEITNNTKVNGDPVIDEDSTPNNNDPNEDDQDFDQIDIFDLSLFKSLQTALPSFSYGQLASFDILVKNEGNVDAQQIVVEDFIPCGFEFEAAQNPNWTYNGVSSSASISIASLAVGEETMVTIKLTVLPCYNNPQTAWTNIVEIKSVNDATGNPADDVDSTPDNGILSEDDMDDHMIEVFDLALIMEVVNDIGYLVGDEVTYRYTIYNQGNMNATDIVLNTYITNSYILAANNPGWSNNAGILNYTISNLISGAQIDIDVILEIINGDNPEIYGEINEAKDENGIIRNDDADSQSNSDTSEERSIHKGDLDDNNILGLGPFGPFGPEDQDDHDPAAAQILTIFDLALEKTHQTLPSDFGYGTIVTYDITVTNEGEIDATNVVITDYINCGLVFNQALNPEWSFDVNNNIATLITDIASGNVVTKELKLVLETCDNIDANSWDNIAEITAGFGPSGQSIDDIDSTPNNNDPTEDDQDNDQLDVFDLSLLKDLQTTLPSFSYGQSAFFDIVVKNEGNVDALQLVVEDMIPCGFEFDALQNPNWTYNGVSSSASYTIASLNAGQEQTITIVLTVLPCYNNPQTAWTNIVEIKSVNDPIGIAEDVDSTPDNGFLSEDDMDDHMIEVFDLALTMEVVNDIGYEDGDEVTYRLYVHNQGNINATEIDLNVYMGESYSLAANNTGWINNSGTLNYTIANLLSNATTSVIVSLDLNNGLNPENYGEIFSAKDGNGIVRNDDADSQSNSDTPEERSIHKGDPDDDNIFSLGINGPYGPEDQDDHDPSNIDYIGYGMIGDMVWEDLNGDGIQQESEPGIENVYIELFNENGIVIRSTNTNINGNYLFENVFNGNYYLRFTAPEPITSVTTAFQGTNENYDNNIDHSNGLNTTQFFNISGGETDLSLDAGFYTCVKIGKRVWYDYNENDLFDPVENGINGIKVMLYRQVENQWVLWDITYTGYNPMTSSDDGWYEFCTNPGVYYIQVLLPPYGLVPVIANVGNNDWIDSDINDAHGYGTSSHFTLNSGYNKLDLGAGYYPMGSIGDKVWVDSDGDGFQDSYEMASPQVEVKIFKSNGAYISSTFTDVEGKYNLDYLQRGDYYLEFVLPPYYGMTIPNAAGDYFDSDVDHSNGYNTTQTYHIEPGDKFPHIDAGIVFGVLPVEWTSISVSNKGDFNYLIWSTAQEINNDHFVVEVKHELSNDFHQIEIVDAGANPNNLQHYAIKDYDISLSGGYYYRVKQIDRDGAITYSDEVFVNIDRHNDVGFEFYPNPTIKDVYLSYYLNKDEKVNINIYNNQGVMVFKFITDMLKSEGEHTDVISLEGLPRGVYLIKADIGDKSYNKPIIVIDNY